MSSERINFRCGSVSVSAGLEELSLDGLGLPFCPTAVTVTLRRPDADADLISAFLAGELSSDGFLVAFSAPIPSEGYHLDWIAFSGASVSPVANSLALDYDTLVGHVARFLGYGDTLTDGQRREVDAHIQSGLRQFYYPPATSQTEAGYRWSFLDETGQLTTTSGVGAYVVPNGVGRVIDPPAFEGLPYQPLPLVSEALVIARVSKDPHPGRPRICCLRHVPQFATSGQRVELAFWPVPDGEYTFTFRIEPDCSQIGPDNPLPLGGPKFSELVLESCLAIAEQRSNDEIGIHTDRFNALLVSAIAEDRKMSAAVFGPMSPCSGRDLRRHQITSLTYNGVPL